MRSLKNFASLLKIFQHWKGGGLRSCFGISICQTGKIHPNALFMVIRNEIKEIVERFMDPSIFTLALYGLIFC